MQGMQVLAGIILMLQAGPAAATGDDELWIERYMSQPGRSAQRLVGRRDTTLLPADVGYYRDRYSVVLDNLPDACRMIGPMLVNCSALPH